MSELSNEEKRRRLLESLRNLVKVSLHTQKLYERVFELTPRQGVYAGLQTASFAAIAAEMGRQEFLRFADDIYVKSQDISRAHADEKINRMIESKED